MSDSEAKSNDQKVATTDAATSPICIKKSKIKFVTATNIHNLKRLEIYNYIVRLRRRIRKLVKKCRQYKKRVTKSVCSISHLPLFTSHHIMSFFIPENRTEHSQRRRRSGRSRRKCRKAITGTRWRERRGIKFHCWHQKCGSRSSK